MSGLAIANTSESLPTACVRLSALSDETLGDKGCDLSQKRIPETCPPACLLSFEQAVAP